MRDYATDPPKETDGLIKAFFNNGESAIAQMEKSWLVYKRPKVPSVENMFSGVKSWQKIDVPTDQN